MTMTFDEVQDYLYDNFDEIMIMELLEINSYDLVSRFEDKLEENFDKILREIDEDKLDM
jgi:hypothetical protein